MILNEMFGELISNNLLRKASLAFGGIVLLAILYSVAMPAPGPVPPEEELFEVGPIWPLLEASLKASEQRDFVTRPLMMSTRRPPVPPAPKQEDVVEEQQEPEVQPIEGVALVGVFGEAFPSGAILRFEDGARKRIHIGETVKGWTLKTLESRKATFISVDGRLRSELEMKFASVKALPIAKSPKRKKSGSERVAAEKNRGKGGDNADDGLENSSDVEQSPLQPDMSTFQGIYERQRADATAGQQAEQRGNLR